MLICAVVMLLGCTNAPVRKPGQFAAESLVWANMYDQHDEPPPVLWSGIDCPGTNETAVLSNGVCYSGLYWQDGPIEIAWRGNFSASAYAHELQHARMWLERHLWDPHHQLLMYWDQVAAANDQLRAAGL